MFSSQAVLINGNSGAGKISSFPLQGEAVYEAMDLLGVGVILVDYRGYVFYANKNAAGALVRKNTIKLSVDGLLSATAHTEAIELRALINRSLTATIGASSYMSIKDRNFQPVLNLRVDRLQNDANGKPRAMVYFVDHDVSKDVATNSVQKMFGLTKREAELAAALAKGVKVAEYAAQQHVSLHTVNTQLKSIKGKTNATSQSDLVRLLVTSFPVLLNAQLNY